jgi:integral membrane sensor domain MASE1
VLVLAGSEGSLDSMEGDWKIYLAKVAALVGAYYGAAKLGLNLAFETESVTAVWPPTGIALAALVLWGYRLWPGVALGAFLANSWTGIPLYAELGITLGNTLKRWRVHGSCTALRASSPRSTGSGT